MTNESTRAAAPARTDRWLKVCLALLLGLGIWPWIQITWSDRYASLDPDTALEWWPANGDAVLSRLESNRNEAKEVSPATVDPPVRVALSTAPLNGKLYGAMARARADAGRDAEALELFRIASLRAPRDKPSRMWLVEALAARGKHDEALANVDQLIRQAPRQAHHWSQYLASYAASPNGRPALVKMLGESNPPWRESFLLRLLAAPQATEYFGAVLAPLREARHPLTGNERGAWVSRLINTGRTAEAYFLWIEGLGGDAKAVSANVHDGGFELGPDNAGFGWHWDNVKGAFIGAEFTPGATGERALSVEFTHRRVAFQHVWQNLMLPPARYRLSGRARSERLDANEGLRWQLLCSRKTVLAQSEAFRGNHDWKAFEADFQVPPEGCKEIRLQLALDAGTPAQSWVGGRAWFDDLAVVRTGPVAEPPVDETQSETRTDKAPEAKKRRRGNERPAGGEAKAQRKRRLD